MKLSQVIVQLQENLERLGDVELCGRKKDQRHDIEEIDVLPGNVLVTYLAELPTAN